MSKKLPIIPTRRSGSRLYVGANYQLPITGFTLVEVIIYVAIIGIVLVSFISFSLDISDTGNKSYSVSEVNANGRFLLDVLAREIKSADSINTSTSVFGSDPGSLSLAMNSSTINPTIFSLDADDGRMQITRGLQASQYLSAQNVRITNFILTNLGQGKNVKINLEVSYNGEAEFEYSKTFRTAVSLRK